MVKDAGSYHCAVKGQETVRSYSVALNVQYGPKKVNLSISTSGDVIKGSSVTFTCSSHANPAVKEMDYSLYKDAQLARLASGQHHIISNVQPSHSGLYYCKAWNDVPENTSVTVDPPGDVVRGISVNLTCSSAANPAVDNYTWYRWTTGSLVQVGSGQVLYLPSVEPSETGHYLCQAKNSLGENNLTEQLLQIQEKEQANKSLLMLAGVGGTFLVALLVLVIVLWFWKKQRTSAHKQQTVSVSTLNGRGLNSPANQDEPDSLYTNVHYVLSSHPPTPALDIPIYATVQHVPAQMKSDHLGQAAMTQEKEVIYSIVKPREANSPQHTDNNTAPRDQYIDVSKAGEGDDNVIYAAVVKNI
ncbi:V-set and immunoglobulin domain-containing protein 1-like [Polymixia lowei]